MSLLPVVLIPKINQKILNKPFYKYTLDDAFKINKEILIISEKKKIKFNFKYKKTKIFYLKNFTKINIQKILNKYINKNDSFKGYIILNAKYPWRNFRLIEHGINFFKSNKYQLIKSLSIAEENPFKIWYFKKKKLTTVCKLKNNPESHSYPRQLLPITYIENGFFEIISKDYFKKKKIKSRIISTHYPSLEISSNTINDLEYLFNKEKTNKIMHHTEKRLPS